MTRKKTLSDLINIGVVIKDLETGGCRDHLLINTAGHDRMDEVYERDRKTLNFHEEKHTTCSDRFVGDGQPRPKVPRKLFTVWNLRSHGERERLSKENIILTKQTNEWMVWHGREKAKASPARAKGRNKTKGKGKQHGKKGKTGCHEMEGTKTRKKHNSVNNTQSGRTRVGNMLTAGLMQDWWRGLWTDPCMGTSGTTIATGASCPRTVQSNTGKKHFDVRWFDDV